MATSAHRWNVHFAAEMTAIKQALIIARDANFPQSIVVATDSLSSLKSIQSGRSNTNPNILNDIKAIVTEIKTEIKIIWIPSHIGIAGNEVADN